MTPKRPYDPEQTPLDGTMLLEASAGTGKTFALERMVARLVGRDAEPLEIENILVVTFTNRAAGEMKERIRSLLATRARDTQRRSEEQIRYQTALSSFDRASLYTIHGFCQMVLATWPFESASPFRQELDPGGTLERSEARRWLAGISDEDVDPELLKVAYSDAGNIEALITSIAREITRDDIPVDSRVYPTDDESARFTDFLKSSRRSGSPLNRAAEELLTRDWSDSAVKAVVKATIGKAKRADSIAKIRSHMAACRGSIGIRDLAEVLFGDPSGEGATLHFLELLAGGFDKLDGEGETAELHGALKALIGEMEPYVERTADPKKPVISLVERYMWCAFYDVAIRDVGQRVAELKDSGGSWAYSDLIRRVADALERPDSPLLPLLRRRYGAALIDEFQDTDPRQWRLFRNLFSGKDHLLVLIGDPKQNIYGFRGTGLQSYRSAGSTVDAAGVYRLDTNYRSRSSLVDAGNMIFGPLFRQSATGGDPVGFQPVASGKTDDDEFLWTSGDIPVELVSLWGEGSPGVLASDAFVAEIRRLLDPNAGARWRRPSGETRHVSASDIAVLVRKAKDEDDILARLAALGIPAVRYRTRTVFAQPAATLLQGVLRGMDRPRAMGEWKAVLLGGLFNLPPDLVFRFENEGRLDAFVERGAEWREAFIEGRAVEALAAFFDFAPEVGLWAAEAGRTDIAGILKRPWPIRIVAETGGLRSWHDWRHLAELIQKKQSEGVREPAAILGWLVESAERSDMDGGEEAVRLETESPAVKVMTMHAAKGLEFPLVFLHGGFGGKSSRGTRDDYRFEGEGTLVVDRIRREANRRAHLAYAWEEDKRLWYVAFTRASVKVWMPRPLSGSVSQIESLLYEALNGPEEGNLPPHLRLSLKESEEFRDRLDRSLRILADGNPSLVGLSDADPTMSTSLAAQVHPEPVLAALPADFPGERDPATSSYTSLVRSVVFGTDDRDVDGISTIMPSVVREGIDVGEALPLGSDRGALFGTLVHALFEECDYSLARDLPVGDWLADDGLERLFSSLARRYYPPDWYRSRSEALKLMVRSTLRAEVPGVGRLCDLAMDNRRPEVEFLMRVPREARLAMEDTGDVRVAGGFLKGFIDLLFKSDGRWWVADWKTNVPPGVVSAASYDETTLSEIMDAHHYHLQYELYLLSLCRSLSASSQGAVDWDRDIGGAAYLFVRGMTENSVRGVYVTKPGKSRMMELASAMGLEGLLS